MFGKRETHLVVLNDLDEAREAVRQATSDASPEELPGLRRALEILDGIKPVEPPQVRWVREVLAKADINPQTHEVMAVREIRRQLPGVSLKAALDLVRQAKL